MAMNWKTSQDRGINLSMSEVERKEQRENTDTAHVPSDSNMLWDWFMNETCGQEEAWLAFAPDGQPGGWYDELLKIDIAPIWAWKDDCQTFVLQKEDQWTAVPIPLTDLIDVVFPALLEVEYHLCIHPTSEKNRLVVSCEDLANAWEENWRKFAKSLIGMQK